MFRSEYADVPAADLPIHDAVPRAASGKILRRELRERA
ncbi:4-coumarate--CoA ligase family protein [Streptomyces sp. ST1015]|nr:4-coumarate--CoA ligase family protein [Streptomyces sp. ST1015]